MRINRMSSNSNLNNISKSKRIASNTILLFVRMLLITLINLYTVRWVLKGLGAEDYGIFNTVASIVTTSTCISSVLAIAIQRFYSYAIGEGNFSKLCMTYSVSINIIVAFTVIILLVFETLGLWFLNSKMVIPADRLTAANELFQLSLAAFIFSILQIPFMGAVFAHENMGVYTIVSMGDCVLKMIIAYLISKAAMDHLVFYGAALLGVAIIDFAMYVAFARKKYNECRYHIVRQRTLYKQMLSFSGWTFYSAFTGMSMIQGSAILLNMFFGPLANTAYGIANQIYNAFNTLCSSVVLAFRPAMTKAYSGKEYTFLDTLFNASNKALIYLLSLVAVPILFEAQTILSLWLGRENTTDEIITFARLSVIYTIALSMQNPITTIIQATGRIKNYTICVETLTLASLPMSWFLFKQGFSAYWIFISMTTCTILAHVLRLVFLKRAFPIFKYSAYIKSFFLPAAITIVINILVAYKIYSSLSAGLLRLMLITVCSFIITAMLSFAIGLSKKERKIILQHIPYLTKK